MLAASEAPPSRTTFDAAAWKRREQRRDVGHLVEANERVAARLQDRDHVLDHRERADAAVHRLGRVVHQHDAAAAVVISSR